MDDNNTDPHDSHDSHSIYSDLQSISSGVSKIHDSKKTALRLNKLKEENLLLKGALQRANATDITQLNTKLRGINVDLLRYKQHNSELKDRVQELEEKLFVALGKRTKSLVADEQLVSSANQADHRSAVAWQSKCKHLMKLLQSYELKMKLMQV